MLQKICLPVVVWLIFWNPLCAQNRFEMNDFERTVKVYNISGKSFLNPDVDVTGSRFFIDQWKPGSVQLNDNK